MSSMGLKEEINLSTAYKPNVDLLINQPYVPCILVVALVDFKENSAPLYTGTSIRPTELSNRIVLFVQFSRLYIWQAFYLVFPKHVEIPSRLDFG